VLAVRFIRPDVALAHVTNGDTLVLPAGTEMRAVVTGATRRHVLALILHDASQPATIRMEEGSGPQLATCR